MKSFFECNLFEKSDYQVENNFSIKQNQLFLKNIKKNNKTVFEKKEVLYTCEWIKQKNFDADKPTIIMPTKNMSDLLSKTITNLENNLVTNHCNLIIVDDRSEEDIKSIVGVYSYLRVDYDEQFNFSMLNNIAAFICYKLGCEQIILWNNDLWNVNKDNFL